MINRERSALSLKELKSFVWARLQIARIQNMSLNAAIKEYHGIEPLEDDEYFSRFSKELHFKLTDKLAGLVARRLKRNARDKPLFSAKDVQHLTGAINDSMEKFTGQALDEQEYALLDSSLKDCVKHLTNDMSIEDLYEDYWSLIDVLQTLADEYNTPVTELIEHIDKYADAITRRTQTKKEFLNSCNQTLQDISIEAVKNLLMGPMFELISDDDSEKMTEERLAEMIPALEALNEKTRDAIRGWYQNEAERIYGTTE
ncbi:MAG: hypothetical protein WC848_03490 [Parcubacteria group bacterium]|jgi:hypothetical protein